MFIVRVNVSYVKEFFGTDSRSIARFANRLQVTCASRFIQYTLNRKDYALSKPYMLRHQKRGELWLNRGLIHW
jgi:hypothetical protein